MKPSIASPCSENWDHMKIGLISRHCNSCRKDVSDFTKSSRHEILAYLIENRNQDVCVRVLPSQLDYKHKEIIAVIRDLEKRHQNTNLSFYLLTMATLTLMSCETSSTPPEKAAPTVRPKTEITASKDSIPAEINSGGSAEKATQCDKKTSYSHGEADYSILPPSRTMGKATIEEPLMGFPEVTYFEDPSRPRPIAQVMPEYKGGTDSLMLFIQQNMRYPRWEKKRKIEGTVYATFVVNENGKIKAPRIIRSVSDSKNFDKEVLRVINSMPDWIPGQEKGIPVSVQFNLPFKFELGTD